MKLLAACTLSIVLSLSISGCSFLHRNLEENPDEAISAEAEGGPVAGAATQKTSVESELARLQTKVEALETKLEVLSHSVEKNQLRQSQPQIEAVETPQAPVPQQTPQMNMAAPVADENSGVEPGMKVDYISPKAAAAMTAKALPATVKSEDDETENTDPQSSVGTREERPPTGAVEKAFRASMELFQNGRNLEASSRFTALARQYPRHLLASHALYWAGEANARSKQWSMAIESWEQIEKDYSRSAYAPDALAGLAKAYESQGNTAKAMDYKNKLLRYFPGAPVTLNMAARQDAGMVKHAVSDQEAADSAGDQAGQGEEPQE